MPKSAVAWRVRDLRDGALDEEQIQKLAADFQLDPKLLRQLSLDLAGSLQKKIHPRVRLRLGIIIPPNKAPDELGRAIKEIRLAEKNIGKALSRLDRLYIFDPLREKRTEDSLVVFLASLRQSYKEMSFTRRVLERRARIEDGVHFRGEPDKRRTRDYRRKLICSCIFEAWTRGGRGLSYTTAPGSSERRGPLIEFVNAVVGCVSTPPGKLNGETIRRELDSFKRLKHLIAE
jgi:hypothetical protein